MGLLLANGVVAEITSDLPGLELIRVPLERKSGTGWQESSCVYT